MLKSKPTRYSRPSRIASRPGRPGYLPISPATYWRWVKHGTLPSPFKINGVTLVDLDAIDAALERAKAAT